MMKIRYPIALISLLLQFAACNNRRDGEGENEDIAVEEDGTTPDLPCGGADLQSDDFNCGACGNACDVMWPGTKYAAGGCVAGECGRTWTGLNPLSPPPAVETCDQWCSLGEYACVPRGCSGLTAFVCETIGDFGDQCDLSQYHASVEFVGDCDEPIPYPKNVQAGNFVDYACCCGP